MLRFKKSLLKSEIVEFFTDWIFEKFSVDNIEKEKEASNTISFQADNTDLNNDKLNNRKDEQYDLFL